MHYKDHVYLYLCENLRKYNVIINAKLVLIR